MPLTTRPLRRFRPSVRRLRRALTAAGRADLAADVKNSWCWTEVGRFVRDDIPSELEDQGCAALIASGDGYLCYLYCCYVVDRDDVRAAMIASGDVWACYAYCRDAIRAAFTLPNFRTTEQRA